MTTRPDASRWSDALALFVLGLAARLGAVAWAGAGSMPGDAAFYRTFAERLASGKGYTWAWPDGAVTAAAHYPVGWPALLAAFDRALTPILGWEPGDAMRHPWAAQAFAALVSAAAIPLVHALVGRAVPGRRAAAIAGALVAVHPGLVLYAPALMTEGPTATALVLCAWLAARAQGSTGTRRWGWVVAAGLAGGVATLVRPQSIVMAPAFVALGLLAGVKPLRARAAQGIAAGGLALLVSLAVCAPWTARNCTAMGRCALVSVNGGWNLLIGSELEGNGGWAEVQVPASCREVWDEAGKDACFGRVARARIAAEPLAFLRLVPRKLAATFDYAGAGPWWLSASRPGRVGPRAKLAAGVVETIFERLLWIACAVAVGRAGPRNVLGRFAVVVAAAGFLQEHAWVGVVALAAALASLGVTGRPLVLPATAAAIGLTAAVHGVFFGAGRYQLVLFPLVAAVASLALAPRDSLGAGPPGSGPAGDAASI